LKRILLTMLALAGVGE